MAFIVPGTRLKAVKYSSCVYRRVVSRRALSFRMGLFAFGRHKEHPFVIAGGDVRGGTGDGALRESLLDLQQRQCYRNGPLDQGRGTQR